MNSLIITLRLKVIEKAKTMLKEAGVLISEEIESEVDDLRPDSVKLASGYKVLIPTGKRTIKWVIEIHD